MEYKSLCKSFLAQVITKGFVDSHKYSVDGEVKWKHTYIWIHWEPVDYRSGKNILYKWKARGNLQM
jgi:hypothetical protein